MILTRLHVENFRQLFGANDITFARPGEKNVTVILGTNGAGKTTLLNAITWCLYEKIRLPQAEGILSNRAAEQLPADGFGQALVELTFEAKQRTYRVRRLQKFKKREDGAVERVGTSAFELYEIAETGESRASVDPYKLVEQLVPEGLSHFFFFRGEDMEDLASNVDVENPLRHAVETFLELKILDRAKDHLQKAGQKLEKQIRDNASGPTLALTQEIARYETDLADLRAKLDNIDQEQHEAKVLVNSLEKKLAEVDELRPFVEAKTAATVRLDERQGQIKILERETAESISRDAYLSLEDDVFAAVERLAEDAVRSGELPAKIKPRFVDDLLASGSCICGRALDDASRAALGVFRGGAGVAGLEAAIAALRSSVTSMRDRVSDFESHYTERRLRLVAGRQDIRSLIAEISTLTSKLEGSPITAEEINAYQRSYAQAHEALTDFKLKAVSTGSDIRNIEDRVKGLKKEREEENIGADLVSKAERRRGSVDRVHDVVGQLRDKWCDVVRRYLDVKLKDTWEQITQLQRFVEFNENFELTISEYGPQGILVRSAPSQANLRALALAFIGALISLAREVDENSRSEAYSKAFYQGGVYGLVMDAPFSTMDVHFKSRLPIGLIKLVPQLVLVTSYDQWEGDIEQVMGAAVGRAFVLELHNPKLEDAARSITVLHRPVQYEVGEPGESSDWTVIREVS